MGIIDRFRRLGFWVRLGVLGAIASIVALPLAILPLWKGEEPTAGAKSNEREVIHQETHGSMSPAISNVRDVNINYDTHREVELKATRQHLIDEISSDLAIANEHVGLVATLLTVSLVPPDTLAANLTSIRTRMQSRSFAREAFVAATGKDEFVASADWKSISAFYSHLEKGVIENTRSQLEALEGVIRMRSPTRDVVADALETWASCVEGNYHVLDVLGRQALAQLVPDREVADVVGVLKYLAMTGADTGKDCISARLRQKYEKEPDTIGDTFDALGRAILKQLETMSTADASKHALLAARARALRLDAVAEIIYQEMIERFSEDHATCKYARVGIDQLQHPERYKGLRGVFVSDFATKSAGRDGGIAVGDVILFYDTAPIDSEQDVVEALARNQKEQVPIVVMRGGELVRVQCRSGGLGTEIQGF